MSTAAAYRHIPAMRQSSGIKLYRRNAVNSGFLGTSSRDNYIRRGIKDSVLLDPCVGSGHFLVYAFEVLMKIYSESGYSERDAVSEILIHNMMPGSKPLSTFSNFVL